MHTHFRCSTASLLLLGLTVAGCAHRVENRPLNSTGRAGGYYLHTRQPTNNAADIIFVMALSGGGTRAAAFAYGVLEELRQTVVSTPDGPRSLLHEVDVISSVSGGSVTAAAYGLYGERVFELLEDAFLKRNVQRSLLLQTLNPFRWPRLWSATYGRSELAADYYDRILFKKATFGDLDRAGGPFLIINSTDITSGARFDFTQHTFDLICSDLESYPLSYAVAASSAVPGALTPITLNNFAGSCADALPDWVPAARASDRVLLRRRANELMSFLEQTNRPYLHLVDGGVSGNLGLEPIIEYLQALEFSPSRSNFVRSLMPRKIVLLGVNAYSSPERDWDGRARSPGSIATAAAAASHTLDRNSFATLDSLREEFEKWRARMKDFPETKVYPIYLSFTNFKDTRDQRFFLNLPTTFVLPPANVEKLRSAGRQLLRENLYYRELLQDLGAPLAAAPPPGALPRE